MAFAASYDGPVEIYRMPVNGGRPERLTYEGVSGRRAPYPLEWKSDHQLLYASWHDSRRDTMQGVVLDTQTRVKERVPLEQLSQGTFGRDGKTLVFTRLPRQSSHAKRYTGGWIEKLWRFDEGAEDAVPLTSDHPGTSRDPMIWKDRVYFTTDRDGTMNLWSMSMKGGDLTQHTRYSGWDVLEPSHHEGRIAFRHKADLWIYRIAEDELQKISVRLSSDFDQTRTRWVEDPLESFDDYGISHDGERVVVTVRGRPFVAPVKRGRVIELPQPAGTRVRTARFLGDKPAIYFLSDRTDEFEFWQASSDGSDFGTALTKGSTTRLYDGALSSDGTKLAYSDRNGILWVRMLDTGETRKVAEAGRSNRFDSVDLAWSPDSRWLAFVNHGMNDVSRIFIQDLERPGAATGVTTDRLDSYSPVWSPDGKWLYFLSDRTFNSVQRSPWGSRAPEAYLDRTTSIFALDLIGGQRSPFDPFHADVEEIDPEPGVEKEDAPQENERRDVEDSDQAEDVEETDGGEDTMVAGVEPDETEPDKPEIELGDLSQRLHRVPIENGNYRGLSATKSHLYLLRSPLELSREWDLISFPITADPRKHKWKTVVSDVGGYTLSGDLSTCLVRKGSSLHVFPAKGESPSKLSETKVDLSAVEVRISPADEWRQLFADAWRMHRDYFYDRNMHGVDWVEVRKKHAAMLPRVTTRQELDDLIAQMVGELSAMHTAVGAGDIREAADGSSLGYLGACLKRDPEAGGDRIEFIYRADPDHLEDLSPLARPGLDVRQGDVIVKVNGRAVFEVPDLAVLLERQVGRKVQLELRREGREETHHEYVEPIDVDAFRSLKIADWEFSRRLETEKHGEGDLGYFHMNAMSGRNFAEFVKGYYPVYNRKGLIIDMRQNYGGNIDSWILSRLLRQRWMFWAGRYGEPYPNMPYAFNGHMVVLIDGYTISDGETFSEGFRQLGLGPLIGTRTWGGGVWLRNHTYLKDGGISTTPENGSFIPGKGWIIEGSGIEPDIRVDNLPHATFKGSDAQLEAAIDYLKRKIAEEPPPEPVVPKHPDKSFRYPSD